MTAPTPDEFPRVSAIVPVYNKIQFVAASIDSILSAMEQYGGGEIIIVDHDSNDGSYELIRQRYGDRATVLKFRGGTIGKVRNFGASRSSGAYLCFLDCDCVVDDHHFIRIAEVLDDASVDATGCKVGVSAGAGWVEAVWHRLHDRRQGGFRNYINSGNLAIRREVFDAVGGFDASLVTGEDAELGERLRRAGYRIYESKSLRVVHLDNPKTLAQFFRKQVWHGLTPGVDKPTAMACIHLVLAVVAAVLLLKTEGPLAVRIVLASLLILVVPVITVAYRFGQVGAAFSPMRATLLYFIFYCARLAATLGATRDKLMRARTARMDSD